MENSLVIFDCFGVIFEDIAPPFLKKHLPDEKAATVKEELFPPADRGEITYDTLLSNMAEALELNRIEMEKEWNSMFILKEDTVDLIKKFKDNGCNVALLSNAPESVVENLFEKHGITELFDKIFVSHKYGIIKPQKEFYMLCVNSFEKEFNKICMIDDNYSNLENLEKIGITPVLFKTASETEEKLKHFFTL